MWKITYKKRYRGQQLQAPTPELDPLNPESGDLESCLQESNSCTRIRSLTWSLLTLFSEVKYSTPGLGTEVVAIAIVTPKSS